MRIGQGFDVHALVAGPQARDRRRATFPYHQGLDGHSDADVLLHAICDALLGAAGLGDIGRHFPDTDAKYSEIDSRMLLRDVAAKLAAQKLRVVNIDATIIAQAPRMAPHFARMIGNIAADLGVAPAAVNIKATTTEGLGFHRPRRGHRRHGGGADREHLTCTRHPTTASRTAAELVEFMRANSFAVLVTGTGGVLQASHLPVIIADGAAGIVIHSHMAKNNPQWQEFFDDEVLVVFAGPHAYVSPRWYEEKERVPTWNYAAVHAYGKWRSRRTAR